jgi:carbon-monoxide dehydrogenase medium subunit
VSVPFIEPRSIDEASAAVSRYGDEAKIIAGGTALVLMLQHQLIAPQALISLGRVPGLNTIRADADGLHIGSLVLLREAERSVTLRDRAPALAHACGVVGNVRVRNQATLGGNLAEADYASDPPTVLLALDANVVVISQSSARMIPLSEFFFGFYTTALQSDEIITAIHIPNLIAESRMTYLKFNSRSSEDRPCVGVAAVATFENGLCSDLRIAVGAACETPRRLPEVERLARGQVLSDELIAEIAEGYAAHIETLDDLRGSAWYRTQMIRVYVARVLQEVRHGDR